MGVQRERVKPSASARDNCVKRADAATQTCAFKAADDLTDNIFATASGLIIDNVRSIAIPKLQ